MDFEDLARRRLVFPEGMSKNKYFRPDLEIFREVVRHLNISKTAETLGVGQSGVSKAIGRLENDFDGPLFVRTSKGVELTHAGVRLKQSLDRATHAFESGNLNDRTHYRIAGHRSVLGCYLPKIFTELGPSAKSTDWKISFATSHQTVRLVSNLEIDFGIVVSQVRAPELISKTLGHQYLALWESHGSNLTGPIAYNPEMIDAGRILRRFPRQRLISIPDYEVIYKCIVLGELRGILPNILIRDDHVQQIGPKLKEVSVNLIYHSQNVKDPAFRTLAKSLAIPIGTNR